MRIRYCSFGFVVPGQCPARSSRRKRGRPARRSLSSLIGWLSQRQVSRASPVGDLAKLLGPVGLGLQRGQQLHALGRRLVSDFDGAIPRGLEDLLSLPRVGPYTAAMVTATSFDER